MGIGAILERLLDEQGRNPNELAAKIGVSASTIYSIIQRNNTKVDLEVLAKIAEELGVTLDYFLAKKKNENHLLNVDEDLMPMLDELRYRPEMRMLFSVSKNASKEDVEKAVKIIEMLKGDKNDD